MSHSSRPLIRPGLLAYAQAFAQARSDLVASMCEIAELRAELEGLREEISELRSITSDIASELCRKADEDVDALKYQLERALIRLAKRDVGLPLH
jgi:chromosome segregation ATPase